MATFIGLIMNSKCQQTLVINHVIYVIHYQYKVMPNAIETLSTS